MSTPSIETPIGTLLVLIADINQDLFELVPLITGEVYKRMKKNAAQISGESFRDAAKMLREFKTKYFDPVKKITIDLMADIERAEDQLRLIPILSEYRTSLFGEFKLGKDDLYAIRLTFEAYFIILSISMTPPRAVSREIAMQRTMLIFENKIHDDIFERMREWISHYTSEIEPPLRFAITEILRTPLRSGL